MPALRASKAAAVLLIAELRKLGALDSRRRPLRQGDSILVPVVRIPGPPFDAGAFDAEVADVELPPAHRPAPPFDAIRAAAAGIRGLDVGLLPRRWELVGDVLVLRVPSALRPHLAEVAPVYAEVLGARTVLEDVGGIRGEWRVPQVRKVWGDGTETVHVENGVVFSLDASKVMFSSGNLAERIRMSRVPRAGETVVDLFAGIGYFAIPMAVHSRAARIVACEANADALRYLAENVRLNRATAVETRLGDCREVAPAGVADRVVMGYFEARDFLGTAFRAAAERCTIHLHGLVRDRWVPRPPLMQGLYLEAARHGYAVRSCRLRRVKSVGPKTWHTVVDAEVERS